MYHEDRPWGCFDTFAHNEQCTVKVITVAPRARLSLQYHHTRDERWRVLSGSGVVWLGDERIDCVAGDDFFVPRETPHRLEAGAETLTVLEVSYGMFDEEDIIRLADDHGRVTH